jgi:hypothetical protein
MNHSAILKTSAIVALIFGALLLLAPGQLSVLYGVPAMNAIGTYNTQLYGAFLLGLAISNWGVSRSASEELVRPVVVGNLVASALALVVALMRMTQPDAVSTGWLNVAIFAVFTAGFGYVLFTRLGGVHLHRPAH